MGTLKDFAACSATPVNAARVGAKYTTGYLEGAFYGHQRDIALAQGVTETPVVNDELEPNLIRSATAGLFTAAESPVAIGLGGFVALSVAVTAPFSGECGEANREMWKDEGEIRELAGIGRTDLQPGIEKPQMSKNWSDTRGKQTWPSSSKK